ncbi:MAG: LLM class flavin-dependent oxidoreductase, partial [Pseudonocardia sp.]|nr:LLM class flavin-dependent oxidoreductase [Pseudonocardia sp.]
MRTATTVEASGAPWGETVDLVTEAERIGLDECWVAEAWGSDAPSALGFLAARTSRIRLGSGIMQVGTRSPVLLAQTALTLADMSQGRFALGLGSSGPQVIEGLHGVPFAHPLGRTRETVAVIRSVFAGERVAHDGRHIRIPLPGGDGRPMRTSTAPNPDIPIFLATLSPRMLELTGEVADGWLGTSFVPEGAAAYLDPLRAGAERAGRTLADLELCQGAEVAFAADERELAGMVDARRPGLAFSLGGMGTASSNFYFDAYRRQGWGERADRVRALWLAGDRAGAAAAVDDDMVLGTT